MAELTLMMDNKIPVTVDRDEFAIIRMMVEEEGAVENLSKVRAVCDRLEEQGYLPARARTLTILARNWNPEA